MNKTQGNYFKMYLNIQDYLDNQTKVWIPITKVLAYKTDFDELISRITDKSEEAQKGVGISGRKGQLKAAIAIKLSSISGALQAFAFENDDVDMATKVTYNKSDIDKMKEQDINAIAKSLIGLANDNLEALADYGITEELISGLLTTLEKFNELIGIPRAFLNSKYMALDSLDKLFEESNSLLKNKLDKIMLMFRENNPEFYEGYQRSRTIVDL